LNPAPHDASHFAPRLLAWFKLNGRKDLPWQQDINAYRVWISEIMLQQTQVKTVIPYYEKFMARFPSIIDLANAEQDEVLHHWSGLGYYARARNLHKTAQIIRDDYQGEFPSQPDQIEALPGIGRSTAGAICSIAFKQPVAILDGNVKRVLARFHGVDGWPGKKPVLDELWQYAELHNPQHHAPDSRVDHYTQAIMDLGASLCSRTKPQCQACPFESDCKAHQLNRPELFPGKKPKKVTPVKNTHMLIIHQHGKVLLFKRPPSGIWGGLWSLPEVDSREAASRFANDQGLEIKNYTQLNEMRHTFSHYHLDISPLILEVGHQRNKSVRIMEPEQQLWYNVQQPEAVGLAAPVSKLLQQLASHTLTSTKSLK
jgi:A/G-specific adenine glycosylase